MLGLDIDPILIIYISEALPDAAKNAVAGIPVIDDLFGAGFPMPIYLSEELTGIVVDADTKGVDMDLDVTATADAGKPLVKQNATDSTNTINLQCNKESIFLPVFIALSDQIFERAVAGLYSVSYLNGATTIFNALVKSITVSNDNTSDKSSIAITLSKANQRETTNSAGPTELQRTRGPL